MAGKKRPRCRMCGASIPTRLDPKAEVVVPRLVTRISGFRNKNYRWLDPPTPLCPLCFIGWLHCLLDVEEEGI